MDFKRAAGIDIGTNTILMVIGEKQTGNKINILSDEHSIVRLGFGVDSTNLIQPEAIERAKKTLESYKALLDKYNIRSIRIVGTSALRDASNRSFVIEQLSEVIGTEIEIIPGEEEAFLSFIGSVEDNELSTIIDIGGGSTEIITGANKQIIDKQSLNIGAVRLTERILTEHPPTNKMISLFKKEIINYLQKLKPIGDPGKIYAVAGTTTTIAQVALGMKKYDFNKVNGYILDINTLKMVISKFMNVSIKGISKQYYIHPKRADVITAGAFILRIIMEHLMIDEVIVSAKGLRYGVMYSVFEQLE